MVETHEVDLIAPDGTRKRGIFYIGRVHQLELEHSDEVLFADTDNGYPDFFEALCIIRRQLETRGILVACYGVSRNVYPSAMCRDMRRGLRAYKLVKGQNGKQEDLVSIFDFGADVEPATVDEQRKFWKEWLQSIGIVRRPS